MTVLTLPVPGNVSRSLARDLVLEGLAASVRVLGEEQGRTMLRIEAPTGQVWKLRSRIEAVTTG